MQILTVGAIVFAGGYVLGSIPFGLIATRMAGLGDIRQVGSGNIGATNVLRTGRKDLALFTLIADGGKGALAVLIAHFATHTQMLEVIAGWAAFLGHLYPVWLKFRGGKGVATFLGVMLAAAWPVGLAACAIWALMAATLRYSSLAALTAAALAPLIAFYLHAGYPVILLAFAMALMVFFRHAENIRRLAAGKEPKIGANKA